ncbi:hypothetical protein AAY473_000491 [Plecturocebus cupreus]
MQWCHKCSLQPQPPKLNLHSHFKCTTPRLATFVFLCADGFSPCCPGWSRTPDLKDLSTSAPQSAGITGVSHSARPVRTQPTEMQAPKADRPRRVSVGASRTGFETQMHKKPLQRRGLEIYKLPGTSERKNCPLHKSSERELVYMRADREEKYDEEL